MRQYIRPHIYDRNILYNYIMLRYFFFSEPSAIYDDSTHPTYKRIKIASLVTHELAHQWFGNLVTPSWWSYLWLSEGFASFFQMYILNKVI